MKTAIVLGSSRSKGNTGALARAAQQKLGAELFDLAEYTIQPYSYEHEPQDDFMFLMDRLLSYDRLILASPMYWYSASAAMKTFLDRISDLLSNKKEKGRELRGKEAALLATGYIQQPPECFEQMFALTFDYLGMHYRGMNYSSCAPDFELVEHEPKLQSFILRLNAPTTAS